MYVYKLSEGGTDFYTITSQESQEYGEPVGMVDDDEGDNTTTIFERVYDTFAAGKSGNQCSIIFGK
ncbi:hypothetical protein ACXH32_000311 [Klebsiella pneumoniae]